LTRSELRAHRDKQKWVDSKPTSRILLAAKRSTPTNMALHIGMEGPASPEIMRRGRRTATISEQIAGLKQFVWRGEQTNANND
jgi:hypothetical protein